MVSISFTQPQYLWALITLPILIIIHYVSYNYVGSKAFEFANFSALSRVSKGYRVKKSILLLIVRIIALLALILAVSGTIVWYSGIGSDFDFIIAIDSSSSMLSKDYTPNRLESAKEAALSFVDNLPLESKIGVISFSGTSFVRQNIIDDRFPVKQAIKNIEAESVGGTDLGDALITSTNMLFNSQKGRAIILLTDGRSNVGLLLDDALGYVKRSHVTVHTIGIGTEEGGIIENLTTALKLDEKSLKKIASETEGLFFRSTDKESLEEAYDQISKSTNRQVSINLTVFLLLAAIILSLLDWTLSNTKFKKIP